MDPNNVTASLAFLAGLASFLSPCVLALVPAYVGYLSGRSVTPSGAVVENRWATFTHGIAFVIGFSAVFVALGAAASAIGGLLFDIREWIARIGGVVVIIFGLHTIGVINIPFLNYDTRHQVKPGKSGYLSSSLMGVFFSAGWAPCRVEMPAIQSRFEKFKDQGLVVLAVDFDEPTDVVANFRDEFGLTFEILLDPGAEVQQLYRNRAYPTTFFIDPSGVIQVQHFGPMNEGQIDDNLAKIG